jgi:D-sedoheptulose 7-phosphate isomerase
MERNDAIQYAAKYRSELLSALGMLDLLRVSEAIAAFEEAQTLNRRIFVCGNGASATVASRFLCDLLKAAGYTLSSSSRVLALTDQNPITRLGPADVRSDRVFVDQLQNFAEAGDVVMGITSVGKAASLARAFEYASAVGCRTVALTGPDGRQVASLADVRILVPAAQVGSVEDGLMIVCRMIGNYFLRVAAV